MDVHLLNTSGAMRSCLAGWRDIFGLADRIRAREGLPPLFPVRLVGTAAAALARLDPAPGSLVMVPVTLGEDFAELGNRRLLERLAAWHREGVTLASACAGSFLLAAAGLLDGRSATTHWSLADRFRAAFPKVRLEPGELLLEHPAGPGGKPGALVLGGGITAYIDVALALVARSGGAALAERVARVLLWDPHRPRQAAWDPGAAPAPLVADEPLIRAEAWAETRLDQDFDVADWAGAVGLERRTFERRFQAAFGLPPGSWLRRRRLGQAKELLTTSRRSWDEIAAACGYADPGSFRRLFVRETGLGPREYRQRFGTAP
jgi:transcriptional regulator GlxA family with amidase domain